MRTKVMRAPGCEAEPPHWARVDAGRPDAGHQKGGQLNVVGVHGRRTRALSLHKSICANGNRGLISVAVDPAFRQNRFIYLFWTHAAHGDCTGRGPEHRVSRYKLRDNNRVSRRSGEVIVDHIASSQLEHNNDDLQFGADGFLYISVGDGLCRLRRRPYRNTKALYYLDYAGSVHRVTYHR
jgi:glucose/arabinose dehydrogenase